MLSVLHVTILQTDVGTTFLSELEDSFSYPCNMELKMNPPAHYPCVKGIAPN
jgi:hypothetical protein